MLAEFITLGSMSSVGLAYLGLQQFGYGVTYWRLDDDELKRSHRDAARVRRTWPRLARYVGLALRDDIPTVAKSLVSNDSRAPEPKIRVPKIRRIDIDEFGVTVDFKPLPNVGLDEFTKKIQHLANHWDMVRASAEQPEPRVIRVRAVRTDPLERKMTLDRPIRVPSSLEFVPTGVDDFGNMVPLYLAHSTGVGIYGSPRWGKTSLILSLMTAFAGYAEVQFILADGKTSNGFDGDYFDIAHRCVAVIGDDMAAFNALIKEVKALREARQAVIRSELGVPNFWDVGPSRAWPLIIVIIDEAHSYFKQIKPDGGDRAIKEQNALAAENAWITEDVVKKCGSVGIFFIIATQKPTVDAIPSAIRDNLTHGLCLGVRTDAVATAALGEAIKDYPESNPTQYMKQKYKGCASMVSEDKPGFVRFRSPFCTPTLATRVAAQTRHLAASPDLVPVTAGTAHRQLAPADPAALLAPKNELEN